MFISVIICTRDRCEKLGGVLDSLRKVAVPDGLHWEVVIVDNGSADATSKLCKLYVDTGVPSYRYVYEGRRGKSFALNRGIREAKGDVLAFTDDDCIVDKVWLHTIMNEYIADPSLAVIGGRVELYNERDKPVTLVSCRERVVLSTSPLRLFDPLIIGANMSIKKEVFNSVGDFDVLLGPGSKHGAIAEDMDFVYRAYRKGFKVVFCPSIVVFHDHGRQTDEDVRMVAYKYNKGRGAFYIKHIFADVMIAKLACWTLKSIFKCMTSKLREGNSIRSELRFLRALSVGAMTRLTFRP